MALLRILSGENQGKIYEIKDDKLIVGRDSEHIPVMDQGVSRQHAELFRIGEMVFIRDLESRNGTFVNEERIEDSEVLRTGDRIHVGNTVMVFEDRFARPQDSRIIRFGDSIEKAGSTISIRLPADDGKDVPKAADEEDHSRLQVFYGISRTLGTGENPSQVLNDIAKEMCEALDADHVYLFAFEEVPEDGSDKEEFRLVADYDKRPVSDLAVSRTILRQVRDEVRGVLSSDAMLDDRFSATQSIVMKQIKSLLCVPLMVMNKPVGAFYASSSKRTEVFSAEDLELATTIGMLVGNAMEMWEIVEKQGSLYRNVLKTLATASEMRTPKSKGKSERVATFSAAIARGLGLTNDEARSLWIAGLLHDIGAIAVGQDELEKAVNIEERKIKLAVELLEKLPELKDFATAITHHNERVDGSGFPDGLKGDNVPREAEVVGVACVFDDLLNHGAEDGGELTVKEALIKVRDLAGKKFSTTVVNGLLIAYRRAHLFQEDEALFSTGL